MKKSTMLAAVLLGVSLVMANSGTAWARKIKEEEPRKNKVRNAGKVPGGLGLVACCSANNHFINTQEGRRAAESWSRKHATWRYGVRVRGKNTGDE